VQQKTKHAWEGLAVTDLLEALGQKLDVLNERLAAGGETRWLTVEAAADYAGLSTESVRRLLAGGKLTAHRPVRGRILIDRRELDSLIESSTANPRSGRGLHRRRQGGQG
jgi:excisionase family DNA binding protein